MHAQGIARALFTVGADAVSPQLRGLRVLHVIYFGDYDGSDSEITDPRHLHAIEETGLAAALSAEALDEARQVHEAKDAAGVRYPTAGIPAAPYTADVEVDADDWLPQLPGPYGGPRLFFPHAPGPATAEGAVARQDLNALPGALDGAGLDPEALNRLLVLAASSDRNSSSIIRTLVVHGADPNQLVSSWSWAPGAPKELPLTTAVMGSACNVAALLSAGADPNMRDGRGQSALELALKNQRDDIATLLRAAGAVH
jgi:hypothetical protein